MISKHKNLFLGIIIGVVVNSLYKSIKKPKKEYNSTPPINNATNFSKTIILNRNNILSHFNELKKQTSLLEEKLNKLKS